MRYLIALLCCVLLSGCAIGSASAGYALRAKTASELTSEAEDRIVQKSVKATIEYLLSRHLIKETEVPKVESQGTSGIEKGM